MKKLDPVDIVIVGAGASGAAAAWRLSLDRSLRIVCLEQGDYVKTNTYPSTQSDWELFRDSSASVDPNQRKNRADYPIDNSQSPISLANFNGVGGSTILYSGHFPRFHPSDFAAFSLDGVAQDWPISFKQLLPYYQLNEQMMGVAGLLGDPANPGYEKLLPPVPLGKVGIKMGEAFNAMGWHWWPSYAAINTRSHQQRAHCINLGPCNTGCAQGAKGSVDVTYWPIALQQGVKLKTNATVYDIPLDHKGRAKGVIYQDEDNQSWFQPAQLIVLACSGAGTPRLLLNSQSSAFPDGLLNRYDLVGRHLMLHPLGYVEAVFDDPLESSLGPQGCCLFSQEFYETDPQRDFVRGYTLQVLRGTPPLETAIKGYQLRQIPLGDQHHQVFAKTFNHNVGIAVISEDLPERHNRIMLDPNTADAIGMPGIQVSYTLSENSKKMLSHGLKHCKQLFKHSGAKLLSAFAPAATAGWHIMGTTRMGHDVKSSVVNPHGQAHDVQNLFILDSSIFVTAGAVNPVATAQALTLKLCDDILKHYRGNRLTAC